MDDALQTAVTRCHSALGLPAAGSLALRPHDTSAARLPTRPPTTQRRCCSAATCDDAGVALVGSVTIAAAAVFTRD